jgi:hypothetical protein
VHPEYRRLRTTQSTGPTLRAWEHASVTTDELSVRLRDFHERLDQAEELLSHGRFARHDLGAVVALLTGPGNRPDAPGDRPAAAMIEQMDIACDEAFAIVLDIGERMTQVRQQLHRMGERLALLHARVDALAFRDTATRRTVEALEQELAEVTPAANADPKGAVGTTVDESGGGPADRLRRLAAGIENAEADLTALSRQQADTKSVLATLRPMLAAVEEAEEAARAARAQVRERIKAVPEEDDDDAALRAELRRVEQRQAEGRWRQLSEAVREVRERLEEARKLAVDRGEAMLALLEERDELRGRLNAYRAMAVRLRHAEDLELAEEYERTYRILWSAPCDLAAAAEAVERYQHAVIERTDPDHRSGPDGRE